MLVLTATFKVGMKMGDEMVIWIIGILLLFILQFLVILLKEHKEPSKLVAWMFIVFAMPFLGFVLYVVVAHEYRRRRSVDALNQESPRGYRDSLNVEQDGPHGYKESSDVKRDGLHESKRSTEIERSDDVHTRYDRLIKLLQRLPVYPPAEAQDVVVYTEGRSFYDALIQDLIRTEQHIHMEFYIFRDDQIGSRITDLLKEKAAAGVEVRCIVDGIGSLGYPRSKISELTAYGVKFHLFLPPLMSIMSKRLNYRNHRKIVVCDGKIGYIGGMNIGIEHLGEDQKIGRWRDTQLRIAGEAVHDLQHTFLRDWHLVSGEKLLDRGTYYPSYPQPSDVKPEILQFIPSGPDQAEHAMLTVMYGLLAAAQRSIYITTPYFIPEESITMALRAAALSGLDVRLLIPGNPDSKLARFATLSHLEELMKAGVRVYEYQDGFIHAKSVIVDSLLATVGTANMDMRSFFSNFELNALVYTRPLVRTLEDQFLQDLGWSREMSYQTFKQRTTWQRTLEAGARMLSPLF